MKKLITFIKWIFVFQYFQTIMNIYKIIDLSNLHSFMLKVEKFAYMLEIQETDFNCFHFNSIHHSSRCPHCVHH